MTKEELNIEIKKLKEKKKSLINEREYCSKNGNIYYSITNIMKINMMIDKVVNDIDSLDFFNFDEEFISYILYMINEIENFDVADEDYIEEEYRFVEFSNEGIITTYKIRNNGVVSLIAKNKNVELLKMKYFDDLYFNDNNDYSNFMYDLADNNDGFFVNTRKDDEKLVINSQMFISNFNYISEFLDKVSGVRLISGKREIDVNSIMSIMNDIILKYQKINKVLRKH